MHAFLNSLAHGEAADRRLALAGDLILIAGAVMVLVLAFCR